MRGTVFAICFMLLIGMAAIALAEKVLWKWVDEKGGTHYSEYLAQVPEKYRSKAVQIVINPGVESDDSSANQKAPPPPPSPGPSSDAAKKAEWQGKARNAVVQVVGLEAELKSLDQQCKQLNLNAQNVPTLMNKKSAADCQQKMDALNAKLAAAQKYLDEGIYKEASGAGAPKEWIAEAIQQAKDELESK